MPGNHPKAEEPTGNTRQEQRAHEEELPKPGNQSKANEPTSGTRQEQGAPKEELPKPGNHPKAEEPINGTSQEQGAPEEELPKTGNHQNKIAEATRAGTAGEETRQTTNRLADTAKTLEIDKRETHAKSLREPRTSSPRPLGPEWQGRKPCKPHQVCRDKRGARSHKAEGPHGERQG